MVVLEQERAAAAAAAGPDPAAQQQQQEWPVAGQHQHEQNVQQQSVQQQHLAQPEQQGLYQQQQQSLHMYQRQQREPEVGMYQRGTFYQQQQQPQPAPAEPHEQQRQQQQQQQQQPVEKRPAVGGGGKASAALMSQDKYTAAALAQSLLQRRDEKGRFYKKEDLAAWARQLHSEGHLAGVPGVPDATAELAAAARAQRKPQPPAYKAAEAAKDATAAAAAGLPPPGAAGKGGSSATAAGRAAGAAPKAAAGSKAGGAKKGSAGSGSTAAVKKQPAAAPILRMNELSLAGCLRRFVRPETLGPAAHWHCSACGSRQAALKQMSIRRLPLVLCFHVKRFEHGGGTLRPKKLDVPMRFPLQGLDMAPFTTSEVLRSRAGGSRCSSSSATDADAAGDAAAGRAGPAAARSHGKPPDEQQTGAGAGAASEGPVSFPQQCLYELFGVVSHHGDMASGHYVSYVKCEGHWYLVNDPWVVAVSEADVAQVQAYMLFYAQEYLFGSGSSRQSSSVLGKQPAAAAAAAGKEQQGAAGAVAVKAEPAGVAVKLEPPAAVDVKQEQASHDPAAAAALAVTEEPAHLSSRAAATAPGSLSLAEQRPISPELGLISPSIIKPDPAAAAAQQQRQQQVAVARRSCRCCRHLAVRSCAAVGWCQPCRLMRSCLLLLVLLAVTVMASCWQRGCWRSRRQQQAWTWPCCESHNALRVPRLHCCTSTKRWTRLCSTKTTTGRSMACERRLAPG
ncbi:hypothetical protein COO60DRAFT_768619 [Scenedesmus sp. NREL 46B-D3]|nr:hypothetical protein COO60DRAFT_768619 [Scenedesmus sp. NREL 46B-D3]